MVQIYLILGSNQSINQPSFNVLGDKHRFQTLLTFFTAGCSSIFWGTCPALTNPRARWRSSSVSRSMSIFAYRIMLSNTTRGIGWARALRSNSCNIKLKRKSWYSLTSAMAKHGFYQIIHINTTFFNCSQLHNCLKPNCNHIYHQV